MYRNFNNNGRGWFGFLSGCYGFDLLGLGLAVMGSGIFLGMSLMLFKILEKCPFLLFIWFIGVIPVIIAILRVFSKNIEARQKENKKFIDFFRNIGLKIHKRFDKSSDKDSFNLLKCFFKSSQKSKGNGYSYFHCPQCNTKLRVKTGRGKISVRCSKCGHIFNQQT